MIWVVEHVIALLALVRKKCLRVTWEEMDAIDQAEDEEAEFIFAEPQYVKGREETKDGKAEWTKYQKLDVLERADEYAKDHGIRRTNTFKQKMKIRKSTNIIQEEAADGDQVEAGGAATTGKDGEAKAVKYVPSKLNKVASDSYDAEQEQNENENENENQNETEKALLNEIELAEQSKPKVEEVEEETEIEDEPQGIEPRNSHGYTETVVVNEDEDVSPVSPSAASNDGDQEEEPLNPASSGDNGDSGGYEE